MLIPDLKDKGILIVDDDELFTSVVSQELLSEGYSNVFIASDGLECLSILEQQKDIIYLILLDLKMPRMDGIAVMRHLANVHKPIVGVVIVTGVADLMTEDEFRRSGTENIIASDYITKPYDFNHLLLEIEKTLSLISAKRRTQNATLGAEVFQRIYLIEKNVLDIQSNVNKISSRLPSFLLQLGLDVLRAVLIGILVIVLLYFGIGDLLSKLIKLIR